jgi:CheY-like chemotaxis protein
MKEKILIVDDEKEIRSVLSKALAKFGGYLIEIAENGEEALKKMEGHPFDLVLTDLKMPRMDGLKLIDQIASALRDIGVALTT